MTYDNACFGACAGVMPIYEGERGVVGDACGLPVDTGSCDGAFERWDFDPATGDCASFSSGGCRGNET